MSAVQLGQLGGRVARREQVPPHQQQDLRMADEGQRGGELPSSAAAVAVGDDAPVGLELQSLQQVRHHLGGGGGESSGGQSVDENQHNIVKWEASFIKL